MWNRKLNHKCAKFPERDRERHRGKTADKPQESRPGQINILKLEGSAESKERFGTQDGNQG
jgi:hypothetical protein